MNAFTRSTVLGFLILIVTLSPGLTQTYDFGTFSGETENRELSNLLQKKKTLWKGRAKYLQFETGVLNDQLLTLSATNRTLRVNLGSSLNLLDGQIEKRIPGKILLLDAHSLEDRPSLALTSVTFLTGDRLKTSVFVIRKIKGKLAIKPFHQAQWELIRPVGSRMMTQQYDLKEVWKEEIAYLKTHRNGYTRDQAARLPDGARVMSLTSLTETAWLLIDASGDLILSRGARELSRINGDFGATPHILKPVRSDWRRATQNEPVRLAPEFIESKNLVAVIDNPRSPSGLLGWFSRNPGPSSIKLFSLSGNTLRRSSTIGPFNQNLFDVEVPPANPNQLLWLRRAGQGEIVLEMIDLNKL